jgi:hypothetical protein
MADVIGPNSYRPGQSVFVPEGERAMSTMIVKRSIESSAKLTASVVNLSTCVKNVTKSIGNKPIPSIRKFNTVKSARR